MKRKRLDREGWIGIVRRRYEETVVESESFRGIVGILSFDEVSPPTDWRDVRVIDAGMKWLHILPFGAHYLITAMLDANDRAVKWYIDVIAGYGACDDGVCWFDDLYLDLVVTPEGQVGVYDMDELKAALREGDITPEQFSAALAARDRLLSEVVRDVPAFDRFCMDVYREARRRAHG